MESSHLHTIGAPAIAAAPLPVEQLREILLPEPGERVIVVRQGSYHLVNLAEQGGLVGLPAAAIEPLLTSDYGAPTWRTWSGRYGPHELPVGHALLLVRDGILRRGPQHWDSGD